MQLKIICLNILDEILYRTLNNVVFVSKMVNLKDNLDKKEPRIN